MNIKTVIRKWLIPCVLLFLLNFSILFYIEAEDVYSLFGKLFLSGRVEYDFTNRRNFLADTEEERVRQDNFDFDRLFRRGFHSVLVIEETAGSVKNILSLGEVPTTFTKFTFDQIDLNGVRWEVRSSYTDWTILMVPGTLNRLNGQEGKTEGSGIGLREVTKFGKSQVRTLLVFPRNACLVGGYGDQFHQLRIESRIRGNA